MERSFLEKLPGVQKNVALAPYTSFQIGGPAKYFFTARSEDEVARALTAAVECGMPFFILAGGSNIVVSDKGFDGLVVRDASDNFTVVGKRVTVESGVNLDALILSTIENGLSGFEKMSGIPGTVGGAVRGNAGAYGQEIKDCLLKVSVLEILDGATRVIEYLNAQCKFAYRESIFKRNAKLIVLRSEYELKLGDRDMLMRERKEIILKRTTRYPPQPSCGSTFKNIKFDVVDDHKYIVRSSGQELIPEIARNLPEHCVKWKTLPAGWLITELGLPGTKIGGAMISREHGNFIINTGNAKAEEVVTLMSLVKQKVRDTYGLQLEEEVQLVGF